LFQHLEKVYPIFCPRVYIFLQHQKRSGSSWPWLYGSWIYKVHMQSVPIAALFDLFWFGLVWWCFTSLLTIFQLYCDGQFYWWRKREYPEKTTDTLYAASYCITILYSIFNSSKKTTHLFWSTMKTINFSFFCHKSNGWSLNNRRPLWLWSYGSWIYYCLYAISSYTVKPVLRGHLWDKEKVVL
jgi:hypothetical protein